MVNFYVLILFNMYNNREIIYLLDFSGGWEFLGIRGMLLKEIEFSENLWVKLSVWGSYSYILFSVVKIFLGFYRCGNERELLLG